ncbi:hypothetical protein psal_cds_1214 [Pandoravirus salinus]|uniref:Uncharacterized protein n=1 Tax=Pandoravirus salinus TaxID=1349410 RepID=S4VYU7_9VIRU|nr:hypothetical protein psal_cds_1214 [Pandoravirus salinus]AGO85518.1 hypothetical protein psal_cds_1214 [Pandoravirus salinus]
MLHWPSSQRVPLLEAPSLPPPPSQTPSVFDRWLADTGRKAARPPPARYTARTRGAHADRARSRGATSSLCLVWPAGRGPKAAGAPFSSVVAASSGTTTTGSLPSRRFHGTDGERLDNRVGGDAHRTTTNEDVNHDDYGADNRDDDDNKEEEEEDYEQYDPTLYMVDQCDWREYIETRLANGITHYNVGNCTAGMPTPADAEYFAALLREVVASRPELGAIESLGGRPEMFVVVGAMHAGLPPPPPSNAARDAPT